MDSHSSLNFISTLYVFSAYHSQQSTFRANEIWIIYKGVDSHQIKYYFSSEILLSRYLDPFLPELHVPDDISSISHLDELAFLSK